DKPDRSRSAYRAGSRLGPGLPAASAAGTRQVTVTRYSPGSAPSNALKVVSRKLPSASTRPRAEPALRLAALSERVNSTSAPGVGVPSNVTAPHTAATCLP